MICLMIAVITLRCLAEDSKPQRKRDHEKLATRQEMPPRSVAADVNLPPDQVNHARLEELGLRFDCYFTLELLTTEDGERHSVLGRPLPPRFRPADRTEMVRGLADTLPDFLVEPDRHSPAVLRIRDRRLVGHKEYPLDASIQGDFRGTPSELLHWLDQRNARVAVPLVHPLGGGIPTGDAISSLWIRGHQGTVRQLLTQYLPLSDYRTTLWIAHTVVQEGQLRTLVRYRGQWSKKLPWRKTNFPYFPNAEDFASGMPALHVNAGEPGKVGEAIRFIETEMKRQQPRSQVRWAMLFLGQEKAEAGIPILLKHLDHLYTPWGVIREAYPAVKALARIGPSASRACLRQLQAEDGSLRRRLLCQVLLDQMGSAEAARALKNAGKDSDAATRHRLADAETVLATLAAEQTPPKSAP